MSTGSRNADVIRVLVVDDDEVDRLWARRALAPMVPAEHLREATDAETARALLREESFDCVLLDHHLGRDTGLALLAALKADGVNAPVVMLTGRGDEQVAVTALKAGASDYLSKSDLSPVQLRRAVRAAIRLAESEAAVRRAEREREQLITALADERQRLRRTVAERDELLAIVSHDLRNPLQSIAIAADTLEEGPFDADDVTRCSAVIRRGVDRALTLIQGLLDLNRLEHGALTLDPKPADVAALVRRVVDDHAMAADKSGVACVSEVEEGIGEAHLDVVRVAQVLDNLVSNAIRHTPRGGRVTVGAARRARGRLELSVADTGPGIPEIERPRLFDRFFQAEGGERPRGSAGLGLAIAKGIVEAHGGSIAAECPSSGGTVFLVTLPLAD